MRQFAPEDVKEIERQYRAGVALAVIARTFEVSRDRIKRLAKRQGWMREPGDHAPPPQSPSAPAQQGRVADVAPRLAQRRALMKRHQADWADLHVWCEEAHRLLRGEDPLVIKAPPADDVAGRFQLAKELLALFEKSAKALAASQESERRAYGVDYKEQEAEENSDEDRLHLEMINAIKAHITKLKLWHEELKMREEAVARAERELHKPLIDQTARD